MCLGVKKKKTRRSVINKHAIQKKLLYYYIVCGQCTLFVLFSIDIWHCGYLKHCVLLVTDTK